MENDIVRGHSLFQSAKVEQICLNQVEVVPIKVTADNPKATRAEVVIDSYLTLLNQPVYKVTANETGAPCDKIPIGFVTWRNKVTSGEKGLKIDKQSSRWRRRIVPSSPATADAEK